MTTAGRELRAPWVVAVMAGVDPEVPQQHFRCKRCGDYSVTVAPMPVDQYVALCYAFIADHIGCTESSPALAAVGER